MLIHGEDSDHREPGIMSLMDNEDYLDPERLAGVIKNRVERGEPAAEIAYYSHEALTAVCTHLRIEGRASMTRKKQMAVALVKHFGGKKKQWKDI